MTAGRTCSALVALVVAGCGGVDERPRTLTVLAASSLTEVGAELEREFEARHPGVDVVIAHAGSSALAAQVRQGLRADVFASADREHATMLVGEGLAVMERPFASNAVVLAFSLDIGPDVDLEHLSGVERIVVGADEVPIGRYTARLFDAAAEMYGASWRAEVERRVVSREPNVRLVAAKVALGEADAAVVYRTDVAVMPRLRVVEPPKALAVSAPYVHVRLTDAPEPELAEAWLDWVESEPGAGILVARGFSPVGDDREP